MKIAPRHVAIIMDGNGRWGLKNKRSRILGHKFGIKNIIPILHYSVKQRIKFLTLFGFSLDNWKRNKIEISNIFNIFRSFYKEFYKEIIEKKINLKIIGENQNLPRSILSIKKKINNYEITNPSLNLYIAFNYSSKKEILNAFKKVKKISIKEVEKNLYTFPLPDPEIIIRTGNANRLSNFLLWQSSYSEIFFCKKLWPDFKIKDLYLILKKFSKIRRKFGGE